MNIKIDFDSHIPLYEQILNGLIILLSSKKIRIGEKLPSVRMLSSQLGVNPATVVRAYRKLEEMGVIKTKKGSRATVVSLPSGVREKLLLDFYSDFLFEARRVGYSEKEILDIVSRHSLNAILICDVGSTTTKAILFRRNNKGDMVFSGYEQYKTTVEFPEEDVWIGLINSVRALEKKTGWRMLKNEKFLIPSSTDGGIDLFLATSSAGGGLQMITVGLVKYYTGESAERTALGAGAIVMDVLAIDDGRTPFEKIMALKDLRPDIILLSGGVEGGAVSGVVQLGEILASSEIKGKFGEYKIPLVYAGNSNGSEFIKIALEKKFDLTITENIRPDLKKENPDPARREILRIFMDHVMKRAPGYERLLNVVSAPILPTPGAVFELLKKYSQEREINMLSFDVGGATTDVFSAYDGEVTRTVSANLGMSYSLLQTIKRAGLENVMKWIPLEIDTEELMNVAANKMISPTSIPKKGAEQEMEIAVAKEIVRIALEDHNKLAKSREITDVITSSLQGKNVKVREWNVGRSPLDSLSIDMVIGSGGILSHNPRERAFEIMLDGINAKGITEFFVDSVFMMPHLGILSSINPALALELFDRECLIPLGTVVSPAGKDKKGKIAFTISVNDRSFKIRQGELVRVPVKEKEVKIEVKPTKRFDAGAGRGIPIKKIVRPGHLGIICDMRERPLKPDRIAVEKWRKIISGRVNG
ncbi:glutamate mutase L [candidate division WOR-3 bacterium]|nr:glutamate mutase L [candidate division WOR-3 bacterium]